MAGAAGFEIVRWPTHQTFMGQLFRFTFLVALVAGFASFRKMGIFMSFYF
jgi:hypothetical protein